MKVDANLIEPLLGLKFSCQIYIVVNNPKLNRTTFGIEIRHTIART